MSRVKSQKTPTLSSLGPASFFSQPSFQSASKACMVPTMTPISPRDGQSKVIQLGRGGQNSRFACLRFFLFLRETLSKQATLTFVGSLDACIRLFRCCSVQPPLGVPGTQSFRVCPPNTTRHTQKLSRVRSQLIVEADTHPFCRPAVVEARMCQKLIVSQACLARGW